MCVPTSPSADIPCLQAGAHKLQRQSDCSIATTSAFDESRASTSSVGQPSVRLAAPRRLLKHSPDVAAPRVDRTLFPWRTALAFEQKGQDLRCAVLERLDRLFLTPTIVADLLHPRVLEVAPKQKEAAGFALPFSVIRNAPDPRR